MRKTISPTRTRLLPIISIVDGGKAEVMESGPVSSALANPLPIVPEQASSAAVAVGRAKLPALGACHQCRHQSVGVGVIPSL